MNKNFIIKKADDFNFIINNGNKVKGNIITIYYYPSDDLKKYFGLAVGKKIGNAVERNKTKRRLRMILHNNQNLFSNKYKYIIMIRKDCFNYKYNEWEKDLIETIGKVN